MEANEEDRSERKKKALEDGYDADAPDVEVDAEVSEATEEERFEAENTELEFFSTLSFSKRHKRA